MKRFLILVIAIPILLGIILRFTETATRNYVFGFDQGYDMLAARKIAVEGKLTLIGAEAGAGYAGLPGIFHGPGYHYFLAFTSFLSRGDPHGAIVALFLISILEVVALAWLLKRVAGDEVGWVAAFFAAISPILISHGRMIWAPNAAGLVALPLLFVLLRVSSRKPLFLFLATFLAASLYHFEIPMAVPTLLGIFSYAALALRVRSIREWGALLAGAVAGFLPMILFELRHGGRFLSGLATYASRTGTEAFRPVQELTGDGWAMLTQLFDSFVPLPRPLQIGLVTLFAFLVRSLYTTEKSSSLKRFVLVLVYIIAANFFVFYLFRGPVYPHYLSFLTYAYVSLAALVAARSLTHKGAARFLTIMVILLFAVKSVSLYSDTIMRDYKDDGGKAKIMGKQAAIDVVYTDAAGEPFGLLIFTPPVYVYPYEYILAWYAGPKYGFIPSESKEGLFYLLMEPDPQQPWSYQGWQETVVKSGTVEKTWTLPSGFIIERRRGEAT